MAQQKLYTEEQIRDAIKSALGGFGIKMSDDCIEIIVSQLTPVLVPKLPDIKEAAIDINPLLLAKDGQHIFIEGAAWTAVKIKEQVRQLNTYTNDTTKI